MLQRNSTKVETCLASAARSYERALEASDPAMREFFQQMEGSWMRLAASIAFSERVDLFLQNWRHNAGGERCLRCRGPLQLKLIEARADRDTITLECLNCGLDHVHDACVEKAT
jgi:hypothetical protein